MGDTNMDTDNPIIVKRTLNSPTIMCVQRKAEKKIVEDEDIVKANRVGECFKLYKQNQRRGK